MVWRVLRRKKVSVEGGAGAAGRGGTQGAKAGRSVGEGGAEVGRIGTGKGLEAGAPVQVGRAAGSVLGEGRVKEAVIEGKRSRVGRIECVTSELTLMTAAALGMVPSWKVLG